MPSNDQEDKCFLFSSFMSMPDFYFDGYCFVEHDFIHGAGGAEEYNKKNPGKLIGGEDGCYVIVNKSGNAFKIGTDFSGYKKIFFYTKNGVWGISNSIVLLAEHLSEKGVKININANQLGAPFIKGTMGNQLASFSTLFSDISMLPSNQEIAIVGDNLIISNRAIKPKNLSYAKYLKNYLETWVCRVEALIDDGRFTLRADLTGGRDSRAIFAIMKKAMQKSERGHQNVAFNSGTGDKFRGDLKSAQNICGLFNAELNVKLPYTKENIKSNEVYRIWRNLNLGLYHPIYFPSNTKSSLIFFGGGGGENHRPFYPLKETSLYAKGVVKFVPLDFLKLPWINQLTETVDYLVDNSTKGIHPLMLHYREFRNRFHAGRSPQYGVSCVALGSSLLECCSDVLDETRLNENQIHYDIMENLCPSLMMADYDKPSKMPTESNIKNITLVDISKVKTQGRVYCTKDALVFEKTKKTNQTSVYELLKNDYLKHKQYIPNGLFSEFFVNEAEAALDNAVKDNKFTHACDAQPISHMLFIGIAHKLASVK